MNLVWPAGSWVLGLSQDYQLQKTGIIEAGELTSSEAIATTLSAADQLSEKTSVEGIFQRYSIKYGLPGLVGYTEWNNEDWFNYALAEKLPVSLGVRAGEDEVSSHRNQEFEQLLARARYSYTEKLVFDTSVGGELRQYENGHPETLSPVFTVTGSYWPAVRTTLSLTGYRRQYAAVFNDFNYASTGANLDIRQGITDRFTADLSLGYYDLEYIPLDSGSSTHTDGYYIAKITLEAKIARHLTGQIYYNFTKLAEPGGSDINDDRVAAQFSLGF